MSKRLRLIHALIPVLFPVACTAADTPIGAPDETESSSSGGSEGSDPSFADSTSGGPECGPMVPVCCGNAVCEQDDCGNANPPIETCEHVCAEGMCVAPSDGDGDGVPDMDDNCLEVSNPDQENADRDAHGDACDDDDDNDGDADETDCAPLDLEIHGAAVEACNGIDDDCDEDIDEPDSLGCDHYNRDDDGDGYGVADDTACLCTATDPYSTTQVGDCNDGDSAINPGQVETCNGIDDDCALGIDESWPELGDECDGADVDACNDGAFVCTGDGSGAACNDGPMTPGATEICNGADEDCSGLADDPWAASLGNPCDGNDADVCANGVYVCNGAGSGTTCAGDANVVEICDGFDNDCDGAIDEGCDNDNDDYCDAGMTIVGIPATCTAGGGDCNDGAAGVHPGAGETCNGIDDDCDALLDAADPNTAWPSADAYENNDVYWPAPEIFEDANPGVAFGPVATSFDSVGDPDYYYWDDVFGGPLPTYMLCRISGMSAGMRVRLFVGYRRSGDPALPYLYHDWTGPDQGSGGYVWTTLQNQTWGPNPWEFAVGVLPFSGIDECHSSYTVQCKLSNSNVW